MKIQDFTKTFNVSEVTISDIPQDNLFYYDGELFIKGGVYCHNHSVFQFMCYPVEVKFLRYEDEVSTYFVPSNTKPTQLFLSTSKVFML